MWDRLLSGVLCLALALGLLPAAGLGLFQNAEAHWADPYGQKMVDWGIMKSSSNLRLGDTTTRAEFAAMLNRAFGYSRRNGMPFTDVPSYAWYAKDIEIAYTAGYFKGISAKKASPESTLTREEAVVMLARCLRLQKKVGEDLSFTDSRAISDWASGLVATAADEGIINGLPGNLFSPKTSITRGEVAAMLVRAIGTPVSKAGSYDKLSGGIVYGNVMITSSDVTLRDTVIDGDLYITGGVDLGNVLLENVTVLGRIIIAGGGESYEGQSSIALRNVEADELVVDSMNNQFVTVSAYGLTDIPNTYVRSRSYLEDSCAAGYGLHYIEQNGAKLLQLAGTIKEVKNKTPRSVLQLVSGTAEKITIDENATGSEVLIATNTVVKELNLEVATWVHGNGDILQLNIGASGCEIEILPEHVWIRPGITATLVDDEGNETVIGTTEADELSAEPRLLSGYPNVTSLRPTSAVGQYAGNKPGTIYWAVSAVADGSVSRNDLINNPAYGGNILKDGETPQSGGFSANARDVNNWPISGLESGGSYYISAVLVDERGNYSPVKVISFSTPDDTTPAFVEGYPYMSKVSCEIAQVTAMANKTCRLYWVLLEAGAKAPTASNFKSGAFGGNYGSGTMSVVKNVPVSIQVNNGRLQEKTGYDLYLWLEDLDGTLSSDVIKVTAETGKESDPSFTTPDETPPVVTSINQTNYNLESAIEFSFTINEAPSKLYWAVVTATDTTFIKSTDDLSSLRVQLKMQNGTGAIVSGSKDAAGAEVTTLVGSADFQNKLSYSKYKTHNFRLYYMAMDADGNCSEVRSIIIHTLDNEDPTVTVTFSSAKYSSDEDKKANRYPQPQADTSITLTFSELVKGDADLDAQTFVDLYSEVERYAGRTETAADIAAGSKTTNPLTKAKNDLRDVLAEHITLYCLVNATDRPGSSKPGTALSSDKSHEYGWLDLREATVTQLADGKVEITLTSGKAVKLGGGMRYYFYFENIFDDSFSANPLKLTRSDGTTDGGTTNGTKDLDCYTETYTTVYAQVWLKFMGNEVVDKSNVAGSPTEDVRMDILMDVEPESMSSTAEEAFWDMIMWCDTSVYFDIYYRVGDDETWTKLNTSSIHYSPNSMNGVSLIGQLGRDIKEQKIKNSLAAGTTYHYGIHFTSVNSVAEPNTKKANPSWSEKVTMWFSIIAGSSTSIDGVSSNVRGSFNSDRSLSNSSVSEIGTDYDKDTENKLEAYRQFTNTMPPEFYDTTPLFEKTSNSITMSVTMTNSGRLYYVVAPVSESGTPSIPTTNGAGKTINSSTDKKQNNTTATANDYMTYIPDDGKDRNDNEPYIYYKSTNDQTSAAPGIDWITDPEDYLASAQGVVWGGPIEVGRALQDIVIDGLKADTKYYVYIVLQGNGDATSEAVEIYQVKTDVAHPPVITINAGGNTDGIFADITTLDGAPIGSSSTKRQPVDSELNWALVNWANLPAFFNYKFSWEVKDEAGEVTAQGKNVKLIDMLVNRTGSANNSPSQFDSYAQYAKLDTAAGGYAAGTLASAFTDKIMDFIKNEGNFSAESERPIDHGEADYSASGSPVSPDFNVSNKNTNVEYGILVFARVAGAGDETENYSFAAAQGMYMPDPKPPEFQPETTPNNNVSYISITGLQAYTDAACTTKPASSWQNYGALYIANFYFSGSITIHFDRPVYLYIDGTQKAVRATASTGSNATTNEVLLENVITLNGIEKSQLTITSSGTGAQQDFTIKFKGIQINASITFPASGSLTNGSPTSDRSTKRLLLQFDPLILGKVFDSESVFVNMYVGGFRATWPQN